MSIFNRKKNIDDEKERKNAPVKSASDSKESMKSLYVKQKNEASIEEKTKVAIAPVVKDTKKDQKISMKELYGEGEIAPSVKLGDKKGKKPTASKMNFLTSYKVIIKPLITEKATKLNTENKYVFEVARDANKISVAKAIESVYGIKPASVNIISLKGKVVRRGRITGRRKNWKKAIVALPAGKSIQVYEGV
ncbi:MAG: 50S ribosomal protein L23 [bacterium]|nr:50S ribosomal protein L23 [bacterium]